jgi:hypothetical protein
LCGGKNGRALAAVGAVVVGSAAPTLAGYLRAGSGWTFTGATTYADDLAQHELWAQEMAHHGRYIVNMLTPEPTAAGWFSNPLELVLGLVQRASGVPYPVVSLLVAIAAVPALAFGLLTVARRAALPRPPLAVLVALLAGSLAPLGIALGKIGLPGDKALWVSYGGDGTPIVAGGWLYLTLAVLTLVALLSADIVSGFRRAGAILLVLGAVYPFFLPVLWLTAAFYAALAMRSSGWRAALKGLSWFGVLSLAPAIYYGGLLPHVDPEFARFARLNHRPLPTPMTTAVSLGLGGASLVGVPRLLRGDRAQQLLACLALAVVIALYVPDYPWRSHLLILSPLLVLGAIAAWWPLVARLGWKLRAAIVAVALGATLPSLPYYYLKNVRGFLRLTPPQYLTSGDIAAMTWLRRDNRRGVVLARSDISPWVAVRSGHRVVVGHYLWTHDWSARRKEVDEIFEGERDPRSLLKSLRVQWVLLDAERGVPRWAVGVEPVARFGATTILRAADVMSHASTIGRPGLSLGRRKAAPSLKVSAGGDRLRDDAVARRVRMDMGA